VPKNLTVAKSLESWVQGLFTLSGNQFFHEGKPLPSSLNQRIVQMATKGEDPTPLLKFWERLKKNPSYRSVNQLWDFLNHRGIPLTKDGCFMAYKSVRMDYKDHHTGVFDNSPGRVNEMPRNQISDDPQIECHEGFHVGSLEYARTFNSSSSSRIIACEIDPENVVCVPRDSSFGKMRVCKYKVIGNHNGEYLPSTTYTSDASDPTDEDREDTEEEVTAPGKKSDKKEKGPIVSKPVKVQAKFDKYQKMGLDKLMECSIDELRQYAGKGLQIVGASKIPGGKTALITKILSVRN
jgi:hypothetical protein